MSEKPNSSAKAADPSWYIYKGNNKQQHPELPPAPPWRTFETPAITYEIPKAEMEDTFQPDDSDKAMVNAALLLRRPLLVTGLPGSGKSSLARSIAYELDLGRVLVWPINSRSTLQEGLYQYDALARLQDASRRELEKQKEPLPIGRYITLGPLGTALLPSDRPRVLLIDEIDKSDIDLPNDLLHVFERGRFEIPELTRAAEAKEKLSVRPEKSKEEIPLSSSEIQCRQFPIVILTSNNERDFPPAFNRRCLRLEMGPPLEPRLRQIVQAHFKIAAGKDPTWDAGVNGMLGRFLELRDNKKETLATDQLLNALQLVKRDIDVNAGPGAVILDSVLRGLTTSRS
jgi:MoxR-like ATPase